MEIKKRILSASAVFIFLIVLGLFCYSEEMNRISIYEFEGNPSAEYEKLLIDDNIWNDSDLLDSFYSSGVVPLTNGFGIINAQTLQLEEECLYFRKIYIAVRGSSSDLIHYLEELSAQQ